MMKRRRIDEASGMRPIGIDLFSGAGGMSLGFEQAGFDIVAAVERDPVHAAVHAFNFPSCAVLARDVSKVSGAEILKAAGIARSRSVDVVFGGAPCQGFSMIGQRALDDPRNSLVKEFLRLVVELDARAFVFENVKGLTIGRHRRFLEELASAFAAKGYAVAMPWKVLNAAEYGVPQSRERLFLLGVKEAREAPCYPPPLTRPAGSPSDGDLPFGPSCADALADLPDAEQFVELMSSDSARVPTRGWKGSSNYAKRLRNLTNDSWDFGAPRAWNPNMLTASMRTKHSDISRRRFAATSCGEVEPISRLFKLPRDGISNTLRAGTDSERGAFTSPRPIHYALPRLVTVREMARLHGFPDWFRFHVTKWHGARQIGNAVPPPLARAVACSIMAALGSRPQKAATIVHLGDPALLRMDMSQAAAYFGIEVPIGRRNKKSGATKRKQHEIENPPMATRSTHD
jgi:DNA (cytosine-5)-methyltransferase 1